MKAMKRVLVAMTAAAIGAVWVRPAAAESSEAPLPRIKSHVEKVLERSPKAGPNDSAKHLDIVLLSWRKDHGIEQHDYPLWRNRWELYLGGRKNTASQEMQVNLYGPAVPDRRMEDGTPNVTIHRAYDWPSDKQFEEAEVILAFHWGNYTPERLAQLKAFVERGGGFVSLHSSIIPGPDATPEQMMEVTGLARSRRYRHGAIDLDVIAKDHPVFAGLPKNTYYYDECYWPMSGDRSSVDILATSNELSIERAGEMNAEPMVWTKELGKGRVFVSLFGHYVWTFDDPFFRLQALRAVAWSAHEPIYRFDHLATVGAPMSDLDDVFTDLSNYKYGQSTTPLFIVEDAFYQAEQEPWLADDVKRRLVELVSNESATVEGRAFAIKKLGTLGEEKIVPVLAKYLNDKDLADHARIALSRIGSEAARDALAKAPTAGKENAVLAELRNAERLMASENKADAAKIYAGLNEKSQPYGIRAAAMNGLLRAEPDKAGARLVEALKSTDEASIRVAQNYLAEHGAPDDVTNAAAELSEPGKRALLFALAARRESAARSVATGLLKDPAAKAAAIQAFAELGSAEDIAPLSEVLVSGSDAEKAAARDALARMRGSEINGALASALESASPEVRSELIGVLAKRNATEKMNDVMKYKDDAGTQVAVIGAIGLLGNEEHLPGLFSVHENGSAEVRAAAEKAAVSIGSRRREAAYPAVLSAIDSADAERQAALMQLLPAIGTRAALERTKQGILSTDEKINDAAVRQLAEWPDAMATTEVQKVYIDTKNPVHRTLALRGLVRLVQSPTSTMNDRQRFAILKDAMERSTTVEDKRLVLSGLATVSTVDTLEYMVELLNDAEIKPEVVAALPRLAGRVRQQNPDRARELAGAAMSKIDDAEALDRLRPIASGA